MTALCMDLFPVWYYLMSCCCVCLCLHRNALVWKGRDSCFAFRYFVWYVLSVIILVLLVGDICGLGTCWPSLLFCYQVKRSETNSV